MGKKISKVKDEKEKTELELIQECKEIVETMKKILVNL